MIMDGFCAGVPEGGKSVHAADTAVVQTGTDRLRSGRRAPVVDSRHSGPPRPASSGRTDHLPEDPAVPLLLLPVV